jgi:hypothetical protein
MEFMIMVNKYSNTFEIKWGGTKNLTKVRRKRLASRKNHLRKHRKLNLKSTCVRVAIYFLNDVLVILFGELRLAFWHAL